MDSRELSTRMVGNEFSVARPRLQTASPQIAAEPVISMPIFTEPLAYELEAINDASTKTRKRFTGFHKVMDFAHHYSVGVFAIMFLVVGGSATQVAANYYSARIIESTPVTHLSHNGQPLAGLNMSLPLPQLDQKVSSISTQTITIQMGGHAETIPAATVQNWLQVVTDKSKNVSYIHVKDKTILASLQSLVESNSKAPKNQVSVIHDGVSTVVVGGINGIKVGDPATAAKDISKHLLAGTGLNEIVPTEDVLFQAVTPAVFGKMIEVNVVTKQMYLYENGNITKTYPISAGAPETPTPIGQYTINSKLAVQDMKGFNPNGTKYLQPHVRWINYFAPGGVAIHGNYWRPSSWFGVRNSSHGCVSLPESQAKEVFDWAPNGTTVITHS